MFLKLRRVGLANFYEFSGLNCSVQVALVSALSDVELMLFINRERRERRERARNVSSIFFKLRRVGFANFCDFSGLNCSVRVEFLTAELNLLKFFTNRDRRERARNVGSIF